jgi:hypothetical protein
LGRARDQAAGNNKFPTFSNPNWVLSPAPIDYEKPNDMRHRDHVSQKDKNRQVFAVLEQTEKFVKHYRVVQIFQK